MVQESRRGGAEAGAESGAEGSAARSAAQGRCECGASAMYERCASGARAAPAHRSLLRAART
eukprot:scaffold103072_cov47-Phaeocystis_antarctica.AAC.4